MGKMRKADNLRLEFKGGSADRGKKIFIIFGELQAIARLFSKAIHKEIASPKQHTIYRVPAEENPSTGCPPPRNQGYEQGLPRRVIRPPNSYSAARFETFKTYES